ncbi:MAG: Fumarate hydratase class II [Phycisphaerae bacterium]|nr:Fumarate hydratase class II [Phycisphaerae bacterium]
MISGKSREFTVSGEFRMEHDLLGTLAVPAEALYGIHTQRALENFPLAQRPVRAALISAYGAVKLACIQTNQRLGYLDEERAQVLTQAAAEMQAGKLHVHVVVDALQGGAGTSTNMNVNEVLANRALQLLRRPLGDYGHIHPIEQVNLHQSTNDTYPTALRVAAITLLRPLQAELAALVESFQRQEKSLDHVVKIGRTQLQDAVLTTLGREMSAYAEALARDRWRIFKCEERLRVVNLGGTAIGTGLAAPREFIFAVVDQLRVITGLGLARAENLIDATQNHDALVEVSGMLKAAATNLFKIANDLRLLSSGPAGGIGEIILPARQAGSSIMPGKVNPVIPEAVMQAALRVMANDQAITQSCALGNLELNSYLPLVADSLLESIELLTQAAYLFRIHGIEGLQADVERCRQQVESTVAVVTALVGELGYEPAQRIAQQALNTGRTIREIVLADGLLTTGKFDELIAPETVTRLGNRSGGRP